MPKSPRVSNIENLRHNPLAEDYSPSYSFKQKAPKKRKLRQDDEDDHDPEQVVDAKSSRKILSAAQDLANEEESERTARYVSSKNDAFNLDDRLRLEPEEEDEPEGHDEEWHDDENHDVEIEEADPHDLDVFNKFNPPAFDDPILNTGSDPIENQSRNLADIILEKIAQHEAGETENALPEDMLEDEMVVLPPKVVEVYTKIGHLLSRYKSGKLPKAFKIIPTLPPAMQNSVIPLTRPESWTPHAIYEATRVFISGPSTTAQSFLANVLLDRVRDDLHENRKLNVHLYASLRKGLYKPAAFFKGLLFPLLQSGTCTLREATIVSSVLSRVSVPVLHSAAALARLCEIAAEQMVRDVNAAGPTNLCIRALLEKRYALPYQTIDALVFHFLRFRPSLEDEEQGAGKLPVIWHQCLLVFAQRYRNEISEEQRESLLDLLLVRGHRDIGPEIRRELLAGRGRGNVVIQDGALPLDGDDTLMGGVSRA